MGSFPNDASCFGAFQISINKSAADQHSEKLLFFQKSQFFRQAIAQLNWLVRKLTLQMPLEMHNCKTFQMD